MKKSMHSVNAYEKARKETVMSNKASARSRFRIRSFSCICLLATLFLCTLNLYNLFFYLTFLALALCCFCMKAKFSFNLSFLSLMILAVCWVLFAFREYTGVTLLFKPFVYAISYQVGCQLFYLLKADRFPSESIRATSLVIASGFLLHLVLNFIINLGSKERNTMDIWSREASSATGQAILACIPLAIACATLFSGTKLWTRLLAAGALVFIVRYNLMLAGRTLFVFLVVIVLEALLHTVLAHPSKKYRHSVVAVFLLICACGLVAFYGDLFGIRSAFMESNFYERFFGRFSIDLYSDDRLKLKIYYLKHMLAHPFGGAHIRGQLGGYAHDLFLDAYDEMGMIGLIAVVTYVFLAFRSFIRCMRLKRLSFQAKQLLLCTYTIILMQFFMEPILNGSPVFMAAFCVMDALVHKISIQKPD